MTARANQDGPSGLPPPGAAANLTAIILCGMMVNWLHWVGAWVLVRLGG